MNRTNVLRLLEQHKGELTRRYGVVDLALFGSTVRNTSRKDSDIDILVSFDGPANSARYFGVQFYLDEMIGFAERVLAYTDGHSQNSFIASQLNYDATLRNLELIGEAATHIPPEVRELTMKIPWRQVIATRNQRIHGYLGIDIDILWSIIREDIPSLLVNLRAFKETLGQQSHNNE